MFFEQLENLCKKHGTTATAFVTTVLGMGNSNVTRWKNGTMPNSDVIIKLAKYFNVTTDYLLLGDDSTEFNEEHLSELIRTFKTLDYKGKIRVQNAAYDELERVEHESFSQNPHVNSVKRTDPKPVPNSENHHQAINQQAQ